MATCGAAPGEPVGCQYFLSQEQLLSYVCFVLCSGNLVWQLSGWGPQNMAGQKCRLCSMGSQHPAHCHQL